MVDFRRGGVDSACAGKDVRRAESERQRSYMRLLRGERGGHFIKGVHVSTRGGRMIMVYLWQKKSETFILLKVLVRGRR